MIIFVEAPHDFGKWFNEVLKPWYQSFQHRNGRINIVATTTNISWRSGNSLAWPKFLDSLENYNYDETPAVHRPIYRLEKRRF
jgi:hypothetical protein